MRTRHEILRDGDRRLEVDDQMPPARRDVQDLAFAADRFDAAFGFACFGVEAEEPFADAEWRCHFALVGGDVDAWGRREAGGGGGEQDPVF